MSLPPGKNKKGKKVYPMKIFFIFVGGLSRARYY